MTEEKVLSAEEAQIEENNQIQIRKEKLQEHKDKNNGIGFANNFKPNTAAQCLQSKYASITKDELSTLDPMPQVKIAGRIILKRIMGRASFITLQDMSGRIQAYIRKNDLAEGQYNRF